MPTELPTLAALVARRGFRVYFQDHGLAVVEADCIETCHEAEADNAALIAMVREIRWWLRELTTGARRRTTSSMLAPTLSELLDRVKEDTDG
jgi:hypothetical protein